MSFHRQTQGRQHCEAFKLSEDAGPVFSDTPVRRVFNEGVILVGLHIFSFEKLKRALWLHAVVAGKSCRAVTQREARTGKS